MAEELDDYIADIAAQFGESQDPIAQSGGEIPIGTTEMLSDIPLDVSLGITITEVPSSEYGARITKIYSTSAFTSPKSIPKSNIGPNENYIHRKISVPTIKNNLLVFRYFPKMVHKINKKS